MGVLVGGALGIKIGSEQPGLSGWAPVTSTALKVQDV